MWLETGKDPVLKTNMCVRELHMFSCCRRAAHVSELDSKQHSMSTFSLQLATEYVPANTSICTMQLPSTVESLPKLPKVAVCPQAAV